jgi:hypothetical protein
MNSLFNLDWFEFAGGGKVFGYEHSAPSPPKPRNRAYSRRGRSQERRVRSTRPQHSRSVCSGNPVLRARKYGFVGCFGRCEQLLVATRSSFSKGALQNDICRFESYMPSQPVRSPLCFFRVCENRRHSRGLGWRAGVSSRQILRQQTQTGARASELEPRTDRGGHGGGSRLSKRDLLPAQRSHLSGNLLPFA